jgi:DNA-binding response OmpR family regulator
MPVMDGVEFRRHQLADPAWAAIPVVVLSALPDGAHLAALLRAVAFLAKPLQFAELLAIARQHCPLRRQVRGAVSGLTAWASRGFLSPASTSPRRGEAVSNHLGPVSHRVEVEATGTVSRGSFRQYGRIQPIVGIDIHTQSEAHLP